MNHHPDNLLSYYESSIPNEATHFPPQSHRRNLSITSDSDSDYSDNSDPNQRDNAGYETSASITRRPGTPSKGGADRRRIAIVQMDEPHVDTSPNKSSVPDTRNSLRARRGHKSNLTGLALVAPPDAALRAYAHFMPPSTAPPSGEFPLSPPLTARPDKGHHRSASETGRGNLPSRDVGIPEVNHGIHPAANHPGSTWLTNNRTRTSSSTNTHRNKRPESPARSPSFHPHRSLLTPNTASVDPPISSSPLRTPEIGAAKDIHIPVAGPVVFQLDTLHERKHSSATAESVPASDLPDKLFSAIPYRRNQADPPSSPHTSSRMSPTPVDQPTPPPPRPPRLYSPAPPRSKVDIDAVKKALQLPPSVSARLDSKSPEPVVKSNSKLVQSHHQREKAEDERVVEVSHNPADDLPPLTTSSHRREGAHANTPTGSAHPSTHRSSIMFSEHTLPRVREDDEGTKTPLPNSFDRHLEDDAVPSVTVVGPPSPVKGTAPQPNLKKLEDWLAAHPEFSAPSPQPPPSASSPHPDTRAKKASFDEPRRTLNVERPQTPLSPDSTGDAPSLPPKSFRNSFTNGLKRWSTLPRSPSRSSRSSRPNSSGTSYSSRTPSPSINFGAPRSSRKIISMDPAALYCHEVYGQRTTAERCAIYAAKINELYLYDCGLSDWIFEMRTRGSTGSAPPTQRSPISAPFTPQPRQTSRSSIISEVTFPRRPDASTATDLLAGAYEDLASTVPPTLPYPSLAINPPRNNSTRSNTSSVGSGIGTLPPSNGRSLVPASIQSTKAGSFFASLGRKTSITGTKRDNLSAPGLLSLTGSVSSAKSPISKTLSPPPPSPLAISRPINITNPPSIPGGPRAPRRPQRSQTLMTTYSPSRTSMINHGNNGPPSANSHKLSKRPSMFEISVDSVITMQETNTGFAQQVDKLHALLPHVDKNILAGYLHQAGQDMLAIGQYLEDERMGTVKRF